MRLGMGINYAGGFDETVKELTDFEVTPQLDRSFQVALVQFGRAGRKPTASP